MLLLFLLRFGAVLGVVFVELSFGAAFGLVLVFVFVLLFLLLLLLGIELRAAGWCGLGSRAFPSILGVNYAS